MQNRGYHLLPPWPRWPVAAVVAGISTTQHKPEKRSNKRRTYRCSTKAGERNRSQAVQRGGRDTRMAGRVGGMATRTPVVAGFTSPVQNIPDEGCPPERRTRKQSCRPWRMKAWSNSRERKNQEQLAGEKDAQGWSSEKCKGAAARVLSAEDLRLNTICWGFLCTQLPSCKFLK